MLGFLVFNFIVALTVADPTYEWRWLGGYTVIADPHDQTSVATFEACLYHCVDLGEDCAVVKFLVTPVGYNCVTYKMLRNIILDSTSCQFYLYNRQNIHNVSSELSELDRMIYSDTYMNGPCPRGTIDNIVNCILATTKTKCLEYADFFGATYNGTHCVMKLAQPRQDYYCVARGIKSSSYFTATSKICYFNIAVPANKTISYYDDQCKAVSPISQLPTICDNETNVFLQGFNENELRLLGLYAPAGTQTLRWYDGSTCPFRGWSYPEYLVDYNTNGGETYIVNKKYWRSVTEITYEATPTQTCQEQAYTLTDYWNNCENLDNCSQINKKISSSVQKDEL